MSRYEQLKEEFDRVKASQTAQVTDAMIEAGYQAFEAMPYNRRVLYRTDVMVILDAALKARAMAVKVEGL